MVNELNVSLISFGKLLYVFDCKQKACVLGAVGTDVMPLQDNRREEEIGEFFRLMRRKFTDDEWCQIRSSGSDHKIQLSVFFRLWCLKESFIKARCFCNPKIRFFSLLTKNVRRYFFCPAPHYSLRAHCLYDP